MIVNLKYLLDLAEEKNCAILAPDFTTLAVARAMIEQAEESRSPLILSFSNGFRPIIEVRNYQRFIQILRDEMEQSSIPLCLHLDHALSVKEIQEAVDLGYTSVMLDASLETYEVNIAMCSEAVRIAHPFGVSVEAELGTIGSGGGYYKQGAAEPLFTDPQSACAFVNQTGVDALAVSIGNVHGTYQGPPQIDFSRLADLNKLLAVPLVLHGTSGLGEENIKKAIRLGIRKINLYSDIIVKMHINILEVLQESLTDPIKVVNAQMAGVKTVIARYVSLLGSCGF